MENISPCVSVLTAAQNPLSPPTQQTLCWLKMLSPLSRGALPQGRASSTEQVPQPRHSAQPLSSNPLLEGRRPRAGWTPGTRRGA